MWLRLFGHKKSPAVVEHVPGYLSTSKQIMSEPQKIKRKGMSREWTSSIRKFNERLGVHLVLQAAEVARVKFPYGGKKTFLYFCGVCWNLIKKDEGA